MYHIIYNPKANAGKSHIFLKEVEERLQAEQKEYEVHKTFYPNHATEIVQELSKEECTLIVLGGDGMMHEVLNGIQDFEKTEVAPIPAGTGNDFCKVAGIKHSVRECMDVILQGKPQNTDYIQVGKRRSLNVAGTGMDVDVLERCERGKLKGKRKYLASLVQSIFLFKGYPLTLTVNGESKEYNALFAAICNGSHIGGGIPICPNAKIEDGKLEVVLVPKLGFFKLIKAFIALMGNKIFTLPETLHVYCEKAEIQTNGAAIQLDGEIYRDYEIFTGEVKTGLKLYR